MNPTHAILKARAEKALKRERRILAEIRIQRRMIGKDFDQTVASLYRSVQRGKKIMDTRTRKQAALVSELREQVDYWKERDGP